MDDARPALRRHRPARLPARRLGPERRRRGPGALHPHRRRGAGRPGRRAQAAVARSSSASARAGIAVLEKAVAGGAGGRRAGRHGRQARRHRLHHGRLRRRPSCDKDSPALLGRAHRLAVPRLRLAAPGGRRCAREPAPGLFVLALTSNPEGAEVQHAVRRGRPAVARRCWTHLAAENAGARPARLLRRGRRRHARRPVGRTTSTINGPLLAPGIGAQGATPADLPAVFGAAVRNVVPNVSRGVLRHGPGRRRAARRVGPLRGRDPGGRGRRLRLRTLGGVLRRVTAGRLETEYILKSGAVMSEMSDSVEG